MYLVVNVMEYRELLSTSLTLKKLVVIVDGILNNPPDFDIVFQLMYDSNSGVAWHAAWAIEKISERYPELLNPDYLDRIISLSLITKNQGLLRTLLSILVNLPIKEPIHVGLLNSCFDWMISQQQAIAVQALSLKLLYKICLIEPDLKPELLAYLENFEIEGLSPAMKATRANVVKLLKKSK